VVVALGAGIGIGIWIAPTSPGSVARATLHNAIAAGIHAGTYHYVEDSRTDGVRDDIVGTAAPSSGRQIITESGKSGTDVFDLRLVDGIVYFRGNEAAVVDQLGVSSANAPQVSGTWVKVTRKASVYHTFEEGITTRSNMSQLATVMVPDSTANLPNATIPTTQVLGGVIVGPHDQTAGVARLDVRTSTSLPTTLQARAADQATGASITMSWTFSRWKEHVSVPAPSKSTPFASLGARPSTSGGG
jgi:hypothetical protein